MRTPTRTASPGASTSGYIAKTTPKRSAPKDTQASAVTSQVRTSGPEQVLDGGITKSIPTSESKTASIDELQLRGTLAPALRRVFPVVARIRQRLELAQDPPDAPSALTLSH
jgi:hypothetical protein